jgi:hypothetical protein
MLDVLGPDISDVSTWYGALTAISQIPIASMIWLEGRMFHHFGVHGLLWTDAAGNLFVFGVVATAFLSRRLRQVRHGRSWCKPTRTLSLVLRPTCCQGLGRS